MKRITALFLGVILIMSMSVGVSADADREFETEQTYAQGLYELGLFLGTDAGFELDRPLTRTEAIVMMIRTLGKADEAENREKTHPFTDVPAWADGYVSYAYDKGLAMGISDTLFGAQDIVESNMFLAFILRAMGYKDGEFGDFDFIWQMPYAMAAELEMLPTETDLIDFVRGDAVTLMTAALFAKCKDTDACLYEKLIDEGIFTKEEWDSAFAEDPFADYRVQNRAVGEAVREKNGESDYQFNDYYFHNHILLDIVDIDETYTEAYVLDSYAHYMVSEENGIVGSGSGMRSCVYTLDKQNWQVVDEPEGLGIDKADYFPESALGNEVNNTVWKAMNMRLGIEVNRLIAEGALAYRVPTHAEKMEKYANDTMYDIEKQYDTDEYTLIAGYLAGVPHGPAGFMYIIYKPGSAMGDGTAVGLPLPEISAWAAQRIPDEIVFSEDGKTMTYSFTFDERMALEIDGEEKRVIHEKGTYNYTTDLATGETSLEIVE